MNSGLINGLASQPLRKRSISITGKTILDQTNTLAGITNKTFVTPVLGAATATSILASGNIESTTGLAICSSGFYADDGGGLGMFFEGTPLVTVGVISGPTSNFEARFPAFAGTVAVTTHSATTTHAMFSAGAAGYTTRAIDTADIATALTTPGAIGGTTASTGAFTTLSGTSTLTLGVAGPTGTAGSVVLKNATNAYTTTIVPSVVTANRQLNLPLITGTDTVAVLGLTQTFTGNKTFSGTVSCGSTLAVTSATTLTGGLNLGPQSGSLLSTTSALTNHSVYSNGATLTLGTNGPSVYGPGPIAWFSFYDANAGTVYFPVWGSPP